jgi:predicted nucleotidyltransferase
MSRRVCGRDEILLLLREHRSDLERLGVKSLALFGSAARGEAREDSDVDLLVEFQRPVLEELLSRGDPQAYVASKKATRGNLGRLIARRRSASRSTSTLRPTFSCNGKRGWGSGDQKPARSCGPEDR